MALSGGDKFNSLFDASAEESEQLENGGFICRTGKSIGIMLLVGSLLMLIVSLFLILVLHNGKIGILCLIIAALCFVFLQIFSTYKLTVTHESLTEEFKVISFKRKNFKG